MTRKPVLILMAVVGAVILVGAGALSATVLAGKAPAPLTAVLPKPAQTARAPSPTATAPDGEVAILIAAVLPQGSDQHGAGFVVRSGDGCLLLTAAHVVQDAPDIDVLASDRPPTVATEPMFDPAGRLDIAALRLGMEASTCPPPPSEAAIQRAVQGQGARLLVATRGGQSVSMPVVATKVSDHEIAIRPESSMFTIKQGMSGSVLVMEGVPVAILSRMNPATGEAAAVRLDYAAKALGARVLSLAVYAPAENAASREASLRAALKAGDVKALSAVRPDSTAVAMVNTLLDEPATLAGFAEAFRSPDAQVWLKGLIQSGLNPQKLVTINNRKRPLLYPAIKNSNVPLAITLLDGGASPYIYEELSGQEYRAPYILFPLDYVETLSASRAEKKALVESMVRAGLTITELEVPKGFFHNEQMPDAHEKQRRMAAILGVRIPTQNALVRRGETRHCKTASASGYDWCRMIAELPSAIQNPKRGWSNEMQYAALLKPLTIQSDHLFVMTYSPESGSAQAGYGLMRLSKDAEQIVWYRFMGGAAGMGHCEELRGLENWRPDSEAGNEYCWRRQVLNRGEKPGTYFVPNYPNVVYRTSR